MGFDKDLVSIVVPVYNVEKYIRRCVDSLICQTYKNIEIILIDDGATDSSGTICDDLVELDGRIKVIHQANGGLSKARNTGIMNSKGNYIAFVDSDDCVNCQMIEVLYHIIKDSKADISMCELKSFSLDSEIDILSKIDNLNDRDLYSIMSGEELISSLLDTDGWHNEVTWNKLYKRTLFDNLLFIEGKIHEDEFMVHRMADIVNYYAVTDKQLYYYYQNSNSIMSQKYDERRLHRTEAYIERVQYMRTKMNRFWRVKMIWQIRSQIKIAQKNGVDTKEIVQQSKIIRLSWMDKLLVVFYSLYKKL